ncbi:MAG: ROK family protein [Clostridia bacterium]|nr:ROK family protein [Clostridia bacterium]
MYCLGIDLGGTNIVAGVVDENYKIIATAKTKTKTPRPAEEIADDMAAVALQAIKKANIDISQVKAMGVGSPGAIDPKNGIVSYSNNLGFENLPLCQMLKDRLGVDFYIENDANAAAYGEYIAGAGKGKDSFIAITLGTGVGGGIIIDGKLFSGSNYAGAELGHTVIVHDGEQCTCGRKGCWETYASATALIRQTKAAMLLNKDSLMWELTQNSIENVSGITAFDAMRKGDAAGKMVVDNYVKYISVGIINTINIFQPDVLCIGGGVSKEGETIAAPIRAHVESERYSKNVSKQTEIKTAELGNDAGIIGAAYLYQLYQ